MAKLLKILSKANISEDKIDAGARAQLASLPESAGALVCERLEGAKNLSEIRSISAWLITIMKKVRGELGLPEYSSVPKPSDSDSDSDSSDDSSDDESGSESDNESESGSEDKGDASSSSDEKSKAGGDDGGSDSEGEEGGDAHKPVPVVNVKGASDEESSNSSGSDEEEAGGDDKSDAKSGSDGGSDDDSDDEGGLAGLVKGTPSSTPGAPSGGKSAPSSGVKAHHTWKSSVQPSSIDNAFENMEGEGSVSTRVSSKGGKRKAGEGKGGSSKAAKA